MKILVTGSAGFIGTNLCARLLADGHEVYGVDNLSTGQETNVQSLIANPWYHFTKLDINKPFKTEKVDVIFNLACPASPIKYQTEPLQTLDTCYIGVKNVIQIALESNAYLIHASTSEIYGDPEVHPQVEEYFGNVNPIGPRSCYDEGKRVAESLIFNSIRTQNLRASMVRIFNTYGPLMDKDDGRVVSTFINQAIQNQDISVFGDGMQTRSFQYIDDLVEAMIALMQFNQVLDTPLNTGNPDEYTILQIAQEVIKLTNSSSKLSFQVLPQDDPKKRKPDITKAKKLLDWSPQVSLQTGLEKTIHYFKSIL